MAYNNRFSHSNDPALKLDLLKINQKMNDKKISRKQVYEWLADCNENEKSFLRAELLRIDNLNEELKAIIKETK